MKRFALPRQLPSRTSPWSPPAPRAAAMACLCALGLLLAALPARAAHITLAGAVDTVAVAPGQQVTLDLVVRGTGPAFNAFDLSVLFDPARLSNVPLSPLSAQRGALMLAACPTNAPFHLFTATADSLVCTMVILCAGVSVTGPGTLYHVAFTAAATAGWTTVSFGPGTAFFDGGPRVDSLVTRPIVVKIGDPGLLDVPGRPAPRAAAELDALSPNPGRHPSTLAVSFHMPRADVAEVTLLDSLGRRVAGSPRAEHAAGAHSVRLDLPRLPPGLYTLVLRTGAGDVRSRPWVVLR